ncbi:MAG: glycosyltransferase family 4 protein [Fibrobacter sp.]|nr:glycosyltransferase family 4 protein [Fibrobacter sp.]
MGSDHKKINICMIAYSNYKSDSRIRREAEALTQAGANITILSLAESKKPLKFQFQGVNVIEIGVNKFQGKNSKSYILSYILFLIKAFFVCSSLALNNKIDAVHVHNMPDFLVFAALLPRIMGKMVVLDIHDTMLETYLGKFGRLNPLFAKLLAWEEKICASMAHKIICVNHVQMIPVIKRGIPEEKITVVMNVPDESIFSTPNRERTQERKSPFKCVYHGTLDKMLGIDIAIKAFEQIRNKYCDIQFHIIGRGKDSDDFERYIKGKNLSDFIYLDKFGIRVDKLRPVLLSMDLGIIPNRKNIGTELMLPVKMLECMALRIPVVAPKLQAIQYYFSDTMVRYYETENMESLADAILDIYNRPDRGAKQAENALNMLQNFKWQKHKHDLIKLYGIENGFVEDLVVVPTEEAVQI